MQKTLNKSVAKGLSGKRLEGHIKRLAKEVQSLEEQLVSLPDTILNAGRKKHLQDEIHHAFARYLTTVHYYTGKKSVVNEVIEATGFAIPHPSTLGAVSKTIWESMQVPANTEKEVEMKNTFETERLRAYELAGTDKFASAATKLWSELTEAKDLASRASIVRTYLHTLLAFEAKADPYSVVTQNTGEAEIDAAIKYVMSNLHEGFSEEEAQKLAFFTNEAIKAAPEKEKASWTNTIKVGFANAVSFVWDLAKGVVSYLYNGVIVTVQAIAMVGVTTFRIIVEWIDGATSKDFGRSGKHTGLVAKLKQVALV